MASASTTATVARKAPPRAWRPGQSGNPRGRPPIPVDIALMCREHAAEAVATLVACLRDPRHKVAAAEALLNRGFGRPPQNLTVNTEDSPVALHLLAATMISQQMAAEREATPSLPTIDSRAEPANGQVDGGDLLARPKPRE